MREILFRGKTYEGEWVQGDFNHYHSGSGVFIAEREVKGDFCKRVNPETVGQYTGLTDKNGKKIFEGDIVRCKYANTPKNEHIQKVVFFGGKFMAEFSQGGCYAELYNGAKHFDFDTSVYMTEIEVLGNIHDNPELLGGADNG